jgi:hypothetical protein
MSKKDKIPNLVIREKNGLHNFILEDTKTKHLIWYDHLEILAGNRRSQQVLERISTKEVEDSYMDRRNAGCSGRERTGRWTVGEREEWRLGIGSRP